jgi:predicted tellurium resistance membrane protein TerC
MAINIILICAAIIILWLLSICISDLCFIAKELVWCAVKQLKKEDKEKEEQMELAKKIIDKEFLSK